MRHLFIVGVAVTLMAVPAVVLAQVSALPVSVTVSGTGTLSGTTTGGGVTGTMTSSGGNWTMTVSRITFASGTYSCSGGSCTYTGMVVGSTRSFSFTTNGTTGAIGAATGFSTHGAWVSTVAHRSGTNQAALAAAGVAPGSVVSSAAKDPAATHGNGGGGHSGDKH
jgi:opacity protein-like surface antigen